MEWRGVAAFPAWIIRELLQEEHIPNPPSNGKLPYHTGHGKRGLPTLVSHMQYHAATLLHPYNEILDRWNAGGITMIFASLALIHDSAELTLTGCLDEMGALHR